MLKNKNVSTGTCRSFKVKPVKPRENILILTSSFPKNPDDTSARFIYEHSKIFLANDLDVTILSPGLESASNSEQWGNIKIRRFSYFLPKRFERLAYGSGILENIRHNPFLIILVPFFFLSFLASAIILSRRSHRICSHWALPSGLIGSAISKLYKKDHILILHSAGVHLLRRLPFKRSLAAFLVNNSSIMIAVSNHIKNLFIDIVPAGQQASLYRKIKVTPMGIDRSYYSSFKKHKSDLSRKSLHTILYVGRLVEVKGIGTLIDAVSMLDNIKLLIAGTGPLKEALMMQAKKLSVDVTFLGQVSMPEKRLLLREADALVLPSVTLIGSRTESMPVTIMEALSMGTPVIATRVGGIPEIIENNYNGLLVPEKDAVALKEAIFRIISDSVLKRRIQINAIESGINYDWQNIGDQYEEILQAI